MNKQIKNTFRLDLSISYRPVNSKEEGSKVVYYTLKKNIPLHESHLKQLFSAHLQSTNIWKPEERARQENYIYMTGAMLDFDNKDPDRRLSINEFCRRFKHYHFILYPSSNHLKYSDEDGVPLDRFRVILPVHPDTYDHFNTVKLHDRAYEGIISDFPWIDSSATGAHTKFFPSSMDEKDFFVKVNVGEGYYDPELRPLNRAFREIKKVSRFTMDTEIQDKDGKILLVRDITEKTIIFCPFCHHAERGNPDRHNASIQLDELDVPQIYCSSCKDAGRGVNRKGIFYLEADQQYRLQSEKLRVTVFRDILTDKFFLGDFSKRSGEFKFEIISKQNISNALIYRGISVPDVFDEAEHDYDFSKRNTIIDIKNGFVNKFIPPKILVNPQYGTQKSIPKYTEKIMKHFTGGCSKVFDSLINHLAYMVQTGDKLRVAFLFQGVQGTGKGIWFNHTIASIFGRQYCNQKLQRNFMKEFNAWLETNYCLLVDEVKADFTDKGDTFAQILKQAIGDRWIAVEGKGKDIKNGRINANLFFATNKRNGLRLETSDRRFIIGSWQDNPAYEQNWWLGDNRMKAKLIEEAEYFSAYLNGHSVNKNLLNRTVDSPARDLLIELSKTNTEKFFEAVLKCDWDWVEDNLVKPKSNDYGSTIDRYGYDNAVFLTSQAKTGNWNRISRNDLCSLYNNIFQDSKHGDGFTRVCTNNGVKVKQMRIQGENVKGVELM